MTNQVIARISCEAEGLVEGADSGSLPVRHPIRYRQCELCLHLFSASLQMIIWIVHDKLFVTYGPAEP